MILSALVAAAPAAAQPVDAKIRVEGAWARRAPMMASAESKIGTGNAAVYATLANHGTQPDALVAARSDAAAVVEIHESYQHMGMMMMRPVEQIDVPAGKKVEMKPGGYHIMLQNLRRDLKPGEVVNLTLKFRHAGALAVTATIR